jgi:hypothetical protein
MPQTRDDPAKRAALDGARAALDEALAAGRRFQADTATPRHAAATASGGRAGVDVGRPAGADRQRLRRESRSTIATAREAHRRALEAWLGPDGDADFTHLSASYPIVLLPARIETRFIASPQPELRVRIYPDEITADAHEPELTDDERAAGEAYWTAGWNPASELAAWEALLGRASAQRAAWIVRTTTPANVERRPEEPPAFVAPAAKPDSWTRAVSARLVPDRWHVLCYRGERLVRRGMTGAVPDPLPLTVSPDIEASDTADLVPLTADGLEIERDILWTVDFAEAERVGMAARIALSADDLAAGFDRVFVVGVKGSLPPDAAAAALEALLDAHHYTRGLAFVPQGTPSNNLSGQPAGYPPIDPDGARSFAVERGPGAAGEETDAARAAKALGVDASLFSHVDGAARIEQQWAGALNRLLWPVTWGYLFEQMMPAALAPATLAALRDYFIGYVRGRGPLPLFRIGGTPYGLLPATSLALASGSAGPSGTDPTGADAVEAGLPDILRVLLPAWTQAVAQVPRAGRTGDPDRDLLELLELDASAREVWIRRSFGPDFSRNLVQFLEANLDGITSSQSRLRTRLGDLFGSSVAASRLVASLFDDMALRFRGGLVSDGPVSETDALDFNYLAWMKPPRSIDDIRFERLPEGVPRPGSLLYRLVRQALLLSYRAAALDLAVAANLAQPDERFEPELVQVAEGTENRQTLWQHLGQTLPNITGESTIADYLPRAAAQQRTASAGRVRIGRAAAVHVSTPVVRLAGYGAALDTLQQVPTAELERLTGETLDVASHRLDAWVTSLATRKLDRLRATSPRGLHVGAFGWVENLRPNRAHGLETIERRDGTAVPAQTGSGGFVHAPSLDHAAAAAVLRNAYLTRSGAARTSYAVDLSSSRVRLARWLLGGVREGQPLTALLGYRFERALHDARLDRFIEPLRLKFPLPVIADAVGSAPTESIPPRDVVHALDLQRAWKSGSLDLVSLAAPPATPDEQRELTVALRGLDDVVDGVTDLLTADAVYHLVRGAQSRAGASLDAMSSEGRPPEGEVAEAPRRATALTHRVLLVLGDAPVAAPGWETVASTPRSSAEPCLDAWLGTRLGSPTDVRIRVTVPAPTIDAPDATRAVVLTLDTLRLRPIDFVTLAAPDAHTHASLAEADRVANTSELERRIADVALDGGPAQGDVRIDAGRDPAWPLGTRSLGEALAIARALHALVGTARPLAGRDLVVPEGAGAAADDASDPGNASRAQGALDALVGHVDALDGAIAAVVNAPAGSVLDTAPLRKALIRASLFGVPGAYPATPQTAVADCAARLVARIDAARSGTATDLDALRAELRRAAGLGIPVEPAAAMDPNAAADVTSTLIVARRAAEIASTQADQDASRARQSLLAAAVSVRATLEGRRRAAIAATPPGDMVRAVFGSGFTWLPRFRPPHPTELAAAIGQGPSLGASADDTRRWIAQAARVRPALQACRRVALLTRAIGTGDDEIDLAQLPFADQARWVGLPFEDESNRPPAGRVSLAMFRASRPGPADLWCGLMIDEWPEVIPARSETTAVSFHYDDPGAEAPQTLLVAVPPGQAAQWDRASVLAILDETLTLARIRGVHAGLLEEVGQILPAIYLAANATQDTVATDFSRDIAGATRFVFTEQ